MSSLLDGLNPAQRRACEALDGPTLILAGAGSGKTRTLTHRVAHLVASGKARPQQVLTVTFTNKAAGELRERLGQLLPDGSGQRAWAMTFHALCVRILRQSADAIGFDPRFSIADSDDSKHLVKECLKAIQPNNDLEPAEVKRIRSLISWAKNHTMTCEQLAERPDDSGLSQLTAQVWARYQERLREMGACDFDDLILLATEVLDSEQGRASWAGRFRYILVDEYQDTNLAQYGVLRRLLGDHRNLCVVGDEMQCVVEGTQIRMEDGTTKPIEEVDPGDRVLSSYGKDRLAGAVVLARHRGRTDSTVEITLASGQRIVSTPEHTHFAGYVSGSSPQTYVVYLMYKEGVGFRVGSSQVYINGQTQPVIGFTLRARQEGADAAWVIASCADESAARVEEAVIAARYGLPTLSFRARPWANSNATVVGDQIVERVGSATGVRQLLADYGLYFDHPHYRPQGSRNRRVVTMTLCGDGRGERAYHRLSVAGTDPGEADRLRAAGLPVRGNGRGNGWRVETASPSYATLAHHADLIVDAIGATVRQLARLGNERSLPFCPASSVREGMIMFTGDGTDVVVSVHRAVDARTVYDLDIDGTHNFIANGVITHNSIYGWRGAQVEHILRFEKDWPDATVIMLEHNYRSSPAILETANAILAQATEKTDKKLVATKTGGEPVRLVHCETGYDEAYFVAKQISALVKRGAKPEQIAVVYRNNAQSQEIEEKLSAFQIRYRVIGGTEFLARAEVKTARAYVQLLDNPRDRLAFERAVTHPKRGVGDAALQALTAYASEHELTMLEAAAQAERIPGPNAKARGALTEFAKLYAAAAAQPADTPFSKIVAGLLRHSRLLESMTGKGKDGDDQLQNVGALMSLAKRFDRVPWRQALTAFLEQTALSEGTKPDEGGAVSLMTVHATKGLEFPYVFLVGLEEQVYFQREPDRKELEEARRLLYVGITRAMHMLWMTRADRRLRWGDWRQETPLRFLDDLPASVVQMTGPKSARPGSRPGTPTPRPQGSGRQAQRDRYYGRQVPARRPVSRPRPDAAAVKVDLSGAQKVRHPKFGLGVVIGDEGEKVLVRFQGGVTKQLLKAYANLTVVS